MLRNIVPTEGNIMNHHAVRALVASTFVLGKTEDGQTVRHPGMDAFLNEHLPKAGFSYGCWAMDNGTWAFGWKAPKISPETMVQVQSDSSDKSYTVVVDLDKDQAVSCTCPAGQHHKPCKHLYRARVKASGSFPAAIQALVRAGAAASREEVLTVFQKRCKASSVNEAIASIVRSAFGITHPHAMPPKKKGSKVVTF
jgi:hypothetical protein